MSTSFLSMASGSRLSNYLGLEMDSDVAFRYPGIQERQYGYIEIPVRHIENLTTGETSLKASRNQMVRIVPACTVNVRGNYRFEVHPDPTLWQYGVVQGMYYLEPKSGKQEPAFHMQLRKDMELTPDQFVIRIYMRD